MAEGEDKKAARKKVGHHLPPSHRERHVDCDGVATWWVRAPSNAKEQGCSDRSLLIRMSRTLYFYIESRDELN